MTSQCPTQSLQSFPVDIQGFTPDKDFYDTIVEPISLSIQWGKSSTLPEFSLTGDPNSGEIYHQSIHSTRLGYAGVNYSLVSVQLTTPTHKKWLALTDPTALAVNNLEDVILTFTSEPISGGSLNKNPQFIILVSPIIRTANPRISSAFLTAFGNQVKSSVGMDSLFPNNQLNQYARYITCAQGITPQSEFQNVLVIVNVQGLLVWESIMKNIETMYKKQKSGVYPIYSPIYPNLFSKASAVLQSIDFKSAVKVSRGYASSVQTLASPEVLNETTDAYKCVPVNPETYIDGVGLKVNSSTGELLTTELAKRKAEIDTYNSKEVSSIPYTILEKYTRIFIIIAVSISAVFIIIYTVLNFTVGPSTTGVEGHSMLKSALENILKVPIYVVIAFFCTFIGLMVGAFISPNTSASSIPAS